MVGDRLPAEIARRPPARVPPSQDPPGASQLWSISSGPQSTAVRLEDRGGQSDGSLQEMTRGVLAVERHGHR